MRARHHASGDVTEPITHTFVAGKAVAPGPVDLAYSAVCVGACGKTHISVIRAFPVPYVCSVCAATMEAHHVAVRVAEEKTTKQLSILARLRNSVTKLRRLEERVVEERVRRDELFAKAQDRGLSSRVLADEIGMTSPGVISSIHRARKRRQKGNLE